MARAAVVVFAGVVVLLELMRRSVSPRLSWPVQIRGPALWFSLFVLSACLSTVYSPAPLLTLFRAGQLAICFVLTILYVTSRGNEPVALSRLIGILVAFSAIILCYDVGAYFLAHDLVCVTNAMVKDPRCVGGTYFFHDHGFAGFVVIAWSSATLVLNKGRRWPWIVAIGLGLFWILAARTRAIFVVTLMVPFLLAMLRLGVTRAIGIGFLVAVLLAIVLQLTPESVQSTIVRQDSLQTWSGRLPAWGYLLEDWKQAPLLGYGYDAGVRVVASNNPIPLAFALAHSDWVQVLVGQGLLGLVPFLVMIVAVCLEYGRAIWERRSYVRTRVFAMATVFAMYCIVTSISANPITSLYTDDNILWSAVLVVGSYAAMMARRQEKKEAHPIALHKSI